MIPRGIEPAHLSRPLVFLLLGLTCFWVGCSGAPETPLSDRVAKSALDELREAVQSQQWDHAKGLSRGSWPGATEGRGYQWAEHHSLRSGVYTILPPNREVCGNTNHSRSLHLTTVSSRHQGGAHVLMGDGAVKFITDLIEAGNSSAPMVHTAGNGAAAPGSKSPYGIWGDLGTRASKEVIDQEF